MRSAVAAYRQALADHDPDDPLVHGKLAPLLLELDDEDGALASYRRAAEGHLQMGFRERALAVYQQARREFPLEAEFHSEAARVHLMRGRRADAALILAEGGHALGRSRRAEGIEMLRGALALQPDHLGATVALASLVRREGRRDEALRLLAGVERGLRGRALRRVRLEMLKAAPSLAAGWRWLKALLSADPANVAARPGAAS